MVVFDFRAVHCAEIGAGIAFALPSPGRLSVSANLEAMGRAKDDITTSRLVRSSARPTPCSIERYRPPPDITLYTPILTISHYLHITMQAARALRPAARRTLLGATRTFATSLPARTDRSPLTLKDHIYTAHATASGAGRNGVTKSVDSDAPIELKLATPKAMGGQGNGQNPEELFAMGYACESLTPCHDRLLNVPYSVLPGCVAARRVPGGQEGGRGQREDPRRRLHWPPEEPAAGGLRPQSRPERRRRRR